MTCAYSSFGLQPNCCGLNVAWLDTCCGIITVDCASGCGCGFIFGFHASRYQLLVCGCEGRFVGDWVISRSCRSVINFCQMIFTENHDNLESFKQHNRTI